MEDTFSHDVEHTLLEADMKRLTEEVLKHREHPEHHGLSEKEIIKKSLADLAPPPPSPAPGSPAEPASPLPSYIEDASAETKLEIEHLVDMAFHKGIEAANREAQKSTPFVLDAFHDTLAGKLYPELKRRGILK